MKSLTFPETVENGKYFGMGLSLNQAKRKLSNQKSIQMIIYMDNRVSHVPTSHMGLVLFRNSTNCQCSGRKNYVTTLLLRNNFV